MIYPQTKAGEMFFCNVFLSLKNSMFEQYKNEATMLFSLLAITYVSIIYLDNSCNMSKETSKDFYISYTSDLYP